MPLAPTLAAFDGPPRAAMDRVHELGFRHVQLSASARGFRPRELGRSARRDLLATLRRRELDLAGLDLWMPAGHLLDSATVGRAMEALLSAVRLASDLGRCPLSVALPAALDAALAESLALEAARLGVIVADHDLEGPAGGLGAGIDPAAWLAAGRDPAEAVLALPGAPAAARLVDLLRTGVRGPVGDDADGRLDVRAYRVALSVKGFAGPVVLDARQWADVEGGVTRSRAAWEGAAP